MMGRDGEMIGLGKTGAEKEKGKLRYLLCLNFDRTAHILYILVSVKSCLEVYV